MPDSSADTLAAPLRRYRPYPAYKDSGVEWLGEIPEHWESLTLSRLTSSRCDGPFGSNVKSEHYSESGVRVVRLQNIGWSTFVDTNPVFLDASYAEQLGDHSIRGGDLLIAGLGDERHPVGRACAAPEYIEPAIVKADCFRFRLVQDRISASFAAYQLSASSIFAAGSLSTGATRTRMNLSNTASRRLSLPPLEEQIAISGFLDQQTAKTDALLTKKVHLIELLQERRVALVTRAVTRSLDPDVPLKESGVEWLGEIPQHWKVVPLYARYEVALGKMLDSKRSTGQSPRHYLRNVDVQWDRVNTKNLPTMDISSGERSRYLLRPGDLLVCEGGEVGRTAEWREELEECYYQKAIHRVRPRSSRDIPRFLFYLMYSFAHRGVFLAGGNPNTIDHLTAVQLRHYRFPFPPPQDLAKITSYLDRETAKIDALIAKVQEGIERLQELRTALISAAVTGKIDVRREVA